MLNVVTGDDRSALRRSTEQDAEAQLLARVRAGDEEASAALVRQYSGRMLAVARQAAVEDVSARVGEIVLAAAERVIGREIQATDHRDLIDEAIAAGRAESTTGAGAGAAGSRR